MQDQGAVKEYIAKYKLEDELSNAVNLAIKENSEDPYLVIANYMKSLSTTDEDYDDDNDDIMEEGEDEMPKLQARGRRDQVMAAKVEIPEGWTPPVHPKSEASKEFLLGVMSTNKLMMMLAPSDRDQLMAALEAVTFESGATIIKQGDPGDNFYIVEDGQCDISVNGVGSVMKATKGLAFGELALLHNAPRAATVTTESTVSAWKLDMLSFKAILMGKAQQDHSDYLGFLNEVPLLKPVSEDEKKTLALALKEEVCSAGKAVICEGDEGNFFYLIRDGEVKCTKIGQKDEVSRRLKRGDFFGELALKSADKRAATVTCVEKTTLLKLDRATYNRMIGSLADAADYSLTGH
mmetsp:Transcript_2857/g.4867  ORF Transcript_2857/g.4867 Transcript_2857/m.4867 type:complete len:350 (-) Transcript_2857:493-1542(-)|eukprot:CAMPEP_0119320258 /NCGR_PEP_ID=MMETSP1333-20130426/52015_1 /TAXON_ID=418940 /ORGANISM="Scyphosphaera apsteinii, Strain RCC1455" /LENGTH=349 /DNA_ID=CAMNT_0007326937 /DNA_START=53 /DNA_END=1102 /DNA_ORIENTATION=+